MSVLFLQLLEAACPPYLGAQLHPHSQLCPSQHPDPDPQSSVPVITPGSHGQPLLKVSWWATLILSATWPPSALWHNIFTDLQDGDIICLRETITCVIHNIFFQSWLVIFFSNRVFQRAQFTHFSEVRVLKFCSANPACCGYLRHLCQVAAKVNILFSSNCLRKI